MGRLERYLEILPLPILFVGMGIVFFAFLLIPPKYRLPVAISLMVFWLPLSEYSGLDFLSAMAKATGFGAILLVAVLAMVDPGLKRQIPGPAWLYLVAAIQSYLYIWTVRDFEFALIIRTQWLFLVIAALVTVRTIVDEASLLRVVRALTIGLCLAIAVPLSDVLLHPVESIRGVGRFFPYEMNSNHIGVVFALAAPLALYWLIRTRSIVWRFTLAGVAASSVGMAILTASRSTFVVLCGIMIPILFAMVKRPITVLTAIVIVLVGLNWFFSHVHNVRLERLTSLETERITVMGDYLDIIATRPLFGVLETQGESFLGSETGEALNRNPHNGYLEVLFFGGITYGLVVFAPVCYTSLCLIQVWKRRKLFAIDSLLVSLLAAIMIMTYAHGFVNRSLFYPTSNLSFFHVFVSTLFMSLAAILRQGDDVLLDRRVSYSDSYLDSHSGVDE